MSEVAESLKTLSISRKSSKDMLSSPSSEVENTWQMRCWKGFACRHRAAQGRAGRTGLFRGSRHWLQAGANPAPSNSCPSAPSESHTVGPSLPCASLRSRDLRDPPWHSEDAEAVCWHSCCAVSECHVEGRAPGQVNRALPKHTQTKGAVASPACPAPYPQLRQRQDLALGNACGADVHPLLLWQQSTEPLVGT